MFSQVITNQVREKTTFSISELLPEFDNNKSALAKALYVDRNTLKKHLELGESSHVVLKNGGNYELYVKTRLTGQSC